MYIEKDEPINLQKIKIMFENGMVLCKHNDKEKNILIGIFLFDSYHQISPHFKYLILSCGCIILP